MANEKPFEIGLVMAGAISAGAYTAGVIDFLLEALDAWEQEKQSNPKTTPRHKVQIRVITGASAGGMTAALIASIIQRRVRPMKTPASAPENEPGLENPLYDAWVSQVDIEKLLSTGDLADGSVKSALNADVLEAVGKRVFSGGTPIARRPYFAPEVDLFLTVTNVAGVPYAIPMRGKNAYHGMRLHKDYLQFVIDGSESSQGVPSGDLTAPIWSDVLTAALASGAFPIGLSAKKMARIARDYGQRIPTLGDAPQPFVDPNWDLRPDDAYNVGFIDGGMIDNEPLELARRTLAGDGSQNPREARDAHRAVLMIDPFPDNAARVTPDTARSDFDLSLKNILFQLIPALKNQARFKIEELQRAMDESIYSRYLIAPIREENGQVSTNIACGSLGGFGGFLDRDFREHDYQLGRRNCQKFLTDHFMLPRDNAVMKAWGDDVPTDGYRDADGDLPIIPVMPALRDEIPLQPWPMVHPNDMRDLLQSRMQDRLVAVVQTLIAKSDLKDAQRSLAETVLRVADDNVVKFALKKVLESLKDNNQLIEEKDVSKRRLSSAWNFSRLTMGRGR